MCPTDAECISCHVDVRLRMQYQFQVLLTSPWLSLDISRGGANSSKTIICFLIRYCHLTSGRVGVKRGNGAYSWVNIVSTLVLVSISVDPVWKKCFFCRRPTGHVSTFPPIAQRMLAEITMVRNSHRNYCLSTCITVGCQSSLLSRRNHHKRMPIIQK